jgi:aminoacyl tRNA synthase complex-interacting multifunctional protein 1
MEARSALATLTVSAPTLASDPLLALIASIAPPFQTKVVIPKKGSDLSLSIGADGSASVITHRNAVLRSLCGLGLHNALDTLGSSPLCFLGGHSASSFAGASPTSAIAMAGISSWMSVADSTRQGTSDDASVLIGQLNDYLSSRSFLVPSSTPTVADLDLYLAIVGKISGDSLESSVNGYTNTRRWLEQCGATLDELKIVAAKNAVYSKVPAAVVPKGLNPKPRPLPLFFYGDEDESVVAAAAAATTAASKAGGAKPGKAAAAPSSAGGGGGLSDEQKKAAADKKAAKNAAKAAKKKDNPKKADGGGGGGAAAAADEVNISALDIRVGKIIKAWEHECAEKLYCEEIDVGEDKPRHIASGLRPFYKLDEMQNRTVLVLCNLKPMNLVGFPSHGMVLCASNADHTAVEFAVPPEGAKNGERVMFEGFDGEPEAQNKVAKKKIFQTLAPDLKTDENGMVHWKGAKSVTSAGQCKAVNGMANAHVA